MALAFRQCWGSVEITLTLAGRRRHPPSPSGRVPQVLREDDLFGVLRRQSDRPAEPASERPHEREHRRGVVGRADLPGVQVELDVAGPEEVAVRPHPAKVDRQEVRRVPSGLPEDGGRVRRRRGRAVAVAVFERPRAAVQQVQQPLPVRDGRVEDLNIPEAPVDVERGERVAGRRAGRPCRLSPTPGAAHRPADPGLCKPSRIGTAQAGVGPYRFTTSPREARSASRGSSPSTELS